MCTFDEKKKVKITKEVCDSVGILMMKQRCFIKNTQLEKEREREEERTARFIERKKERKRGEERTRERTHLIGLFLFSSFV